MGRPSSGVVTETWVDEKGKMGLRNHVERKQNTKFYPPTGFYEAGKRHIMFYAGPMFH